MNKEELKPFAVADIEASNWIKFEVIGVFDGSKYAYFTSLKKFMQYIDKKEYSGYTFYFHNGGKYDFLFFMEEIYNSSWESSLIERGGRIISIKIKTKKTHFTFADSYVLLPASQALLAESFGVKHDKQKFNFEKERVSVKNKKLMKRLEYDCKGMYEILNAFFTQEFITKQKLTIASTALSTFTDKFFKGDLVELEIDHEEEIRTNFYHGGRVELYKSYGKNINVYDVNSLYPFCMLQEMPTGDCRKTLSYHKDKIGFYKVRVISTPDFYIPPYLIKNAEGKNIFVNGKGEYFLSSCMLEYLKKVFGVKFSVIYGLVFKSRDYLFNDYVDYFFKLKKEAKEGTGTKYLAKLFLNTLYGKFGMKRMNQVVEQYNGQTSFQTYNESELSEKLNLVLIDRASKSNFIFPYIAAWITDLARLHHFKLMQLHEKNVFYCDTDSIFSDKIFPHSKEIGDLDFRGNFEAIFLGSKTYALRNSKEEIIKFKGFNAENFRFKDFVDALKNGKELIEERKRILGFKECFRRKEGIIQNEGIFLKRVNTVKQFQIEYDKRKLFKDKKYIFDSTAFNREEIL